MFNFFKANLFIKALLLISFYLTPLFSQIQYTNVFNPADSVQLKTDFSKQNITWNWDEKFQYIEYNPGWFSWDLYNNYRSNLITPSNTSKRWKDEHDLNGLFYYNHNNNNFGLYTKSWILLDKQQDNH